MDIRQEVLKRIVHENNQFVNREIARALLRNDFEFAQTLRVEYLRDERKDH